MLEIWYFEFGEGCGKMLKWKGKETMFFYFKWNP